MKSKTKVLGLSIVFAGLCGCGGGSGGSHSPTVTADPVGFPVSFAAFQNGATGAWVPVSVGSDGRYRGNVTSADGRYGFALYESDSSQLWIWQGTLAETNYVSIPSGGPQTTTASVTGTVSDLAANQDLNITAADGNQVVTANGNYSITADLTQPWDAIALFDNAGTPTTATIRRNIGASTTTQNFDATAAEFQPVVPYSVTVTPSSNAASTLSGLQIVTANGTQAVLGAAAGTTVPIYAPASNERNSGDTYQYISQTSNAAQDQLGTTTILEATPNNFSIVAPNIASPVTLTATTGANPLIQASWTPDPSAKVFWFSTDSSNGVTEYDAYVTQGWLGNNTAKTYTTPDLSGVPGWSATYALPATISAWSYQGSASSLSVDALINGPTTVPNGTSFTDWNQDEGNTAAIAKRHAQHPFRSTFRGLHNLLAHRKALRP